MLSFFYRGGQFEVFLDISLVVPLEDFLQGRQDDLQLYDVGDPLQVPLHGQDRVAILASIIYQRE
jgi:hypothetical protein